MTVDCGRGGGGGGGGGGACCGRRGRSREGGGQGAREGGEGRPLMAFLFQKSLVPFINPKHFVVFEYQHRACKAPLFVLAWL